METLKNVLKPEKQQMAMWFIGWSIPAAIGTIVWLVLLGCIPSSEVPKFVWVLCLSCNN